MPRETRSWVLEPLGALVRDAPRERVLRVGEEPVRPDLEHLVIGLRNLREVGRGAHLEQAGAREDLFRRRA